MKLKLPRSRLVQIALLLAAMFVIHLVNAVGGLWLSRFGIMPRSIVGLRGIVFAPLLHGSWGHLIANAVPLVVMLVLLSVSNRRLLWPMTAAIWVVSGLVVWVVGRPGAVQIGASGLIYGLAAYLVTLAWMKRDIRSALIALFVIFFYGGIVWGLLPSQPGVSWEGHLAGAFTGFLFARFARKKRLPS